ncbi:dipeptidase [Paractinoplanes globisporus]|uniref:Dipeptidase n=1 Tax=Paractinoplanes globisporus TaxID=113565 RepID=A0ABW6WER7_9ACTN|nr:dipeptidase [Actinoplanes globisporus]
MMPIIDGHNDLPMQLRGRFGYRVEGLDEHRPELQTDIPRLRAGGVGGQFWSVYVPSPLSEPEAVVATMEQIDAVYRMAAAYPDDLAIACSADDVERIIGEGRIASLIGIEGGHSIATSLGVLRAFARLGVRYMTLTHNDNTSWADSAAAEPAVQGLNDDGRAVVREMQRVGMLVDLSHVAPVTMHAALDTAFAPVLFSHSGCRALHDHPRNVPDDVLTRLRDNGGVIQLTFVAPFVSAESLDWMRAADAEWERLGLPDVSAIALWPRAPRPAEDPAAVPATLDLDPLAEPAFRAWMAAHPRPLVTVAQVADHVDHARDIAGVDHIGLGGDFDGTTELPEGLTDVAGYPLLLAELASRGWSEADLGKLAGRNVLRVLRESERLAQEPLWPLVPAR